MKNKIMKVIEYLTWLFIAFTSGMGLGTLVCKCMGEDPFKWYEWSLKHKIIYVVVCTVLLIPCVIWISAGHIAISEKMDEEFEDN